jgi:hypothetical protein
MISLEEYRKIMKDEISSDELILKRIQYLEAFCKNIIHVELEKYSKTLK